MHHHLRPAMLPVLAAAFLLLATLSQAHNITRILAQHPEFSTFNHYLTLTHLAPEINGRTTITVCAVDNSAMDDLLSKHPSIYTVKNILSLHVLLDYFGAKKLHQITNGTALAATMYQATGTAPGSAGFVNITDLHGGKVAFGAENNDGTLTSTFVKSVEEIPYNISVIQISKILPSAAAEAPAPAPAQQNLTSIMSKHGCKVFADTLSNFSDALSTFNDNLDGGLTVFCPLDDAFKAFLPKFKNLTASGKLALLEFHGVPVYQSLATLKSNNGLQNTLATDGANKFDFTVQNDGEDVTLKTRLTTAKITDTIIDEQPLAVFAISKVLLPKELFKGEALAPAPAPEPSAADAPAPAKKGKKKKKAADAPAADANSDAPADSPGDAADDTADDSNGAVSGGSYGNVVVALGLVLGLSLVL
ncbi:Fasciclin-like arabinogalactan protein [Vigna angularis]|uniref:Fasciclin-like arabinogalactan protein n=1 Tax=Phaseolus angularis TaxID=3914 RepID=A0A8T0K5L5_PHAAN|nr:fasciclin-like arabinogalactan protein 1 [Vigna angularis]KAG2394778.1 Fasciclin-like arabinogalactan protein [Vigna angularis]